MSKLNKIGLDKEHSIELASKLNDLLSNYQVFYQNTRGFHWNIRGDKFFELHAKFEELYTDLQGKIDEIAERILTLSATPLHTFDDYLKVSKVKQVQNESDAEKCVESIVVAFGILLEKQRVILELSAKYNDEGTNAMASDYIRQQEKLVWMYNAWLD
ncbi:MAG TPA: Dps family protein [Bacteroidales bacterium]|nr:Dps family protein [Bacteroidales bacterium]